MTKNSELKDCDCEDWKVNLPLINDKIVVNFIRTGVQYAGKPFIYCPWCGKARTP